MSAKSDEKNNEKTFKQSKIYLGDKTIGGHTHHQQQTHFNLKEDKYLEDEEEEEEENYCEEKRKNKKVIKNNKYDEKYSADTKDNRSSSSSSIHHPSHSHQNSHTSHTINKTTIGREISDDSIEEAEEADREFESLMRKPNQG